MLKKMSQDEEEKASIEYQVKIWFCRTICITTNEWLVADLDK